jgi:hypothetical protein
MKSWSLRSAVLVITALCLSCVTAPAQSSNKSKSGSSGSGSGGSGGSGTGTGQSEAGASGLGFSIETEMFTYQAVEANSRVIACDIARYLYGGQLASPGTGGSVPCVIQNQSQNSPGIILVSSGSNLLPEFGLWRADMAMMNSLEQRADQVCIAKPQSEGANNEPGSGNSKSSGITDRGLLSSLIANASPATAAASGAMSAMSMLASNQSVTSVVGTVEDPAVLNEVARQLRTLGVQVLIPEMYGPNALGPPDYSHSPYMTNLQNLFNVYDKCEKAKASYGENSPPAADMNAVTTAIDTFLKSAFVTSGGEIPGSTQPPAASPSSQSPGTTPSTSHFAAVLAADELAQEMGYTANGTTPNSGTWQHLMWLQALESGGSVSKQGNLFGTKVYFGGGAVDTYSVFRMDGQLVCSGNVFSFQPPVKLNDLVKTFQKGLSDDPTKSPLLQSSCSPLPPPMQH